MIMKMMLSGCYGNQLVYFNITSLRKHLVVKNKASTILINAKGKYKPVRGYMHYVMGDGSWEGYCPFGMILKELGYDISAGVMWHFDTNKELKKLGLEDRHVNHILKMFDTKHYTIDQIIDYLKGEGL